MNKEKKQKSFDDQPLTTVGEFLLYTTEDGQSRVECRFEMATCKDYLQVRQEGTREVSRAIEDAAATDTIKQLVDLSKKSSEDNK